jgi:hypothetical protein
MKSLLVSRSRLSEVDKSAMRDLLQSQFEGVTACSFDGDLAEKSWAILLKDDAGALTAFTTLDLYASRFQGRLVWVVYSGDTVVHPSNWHSHSLMQAWWPCILALQNAHDAKPLYWMLISSGFRTYRYLPAFAHEFYPRVGHPTPPEMQALMDHLAVERFASGYDGVNGIVRPRAIYPLRSDLAAIPQERLTDPDITFFLERNPGHAEGEELMCLAEVTPENLTPLGRRVVARAIPPEIIGLPP